MLCRRLMVVAVRVNEVLHDKRLRMDPDSNPAIAAKGAPMITLIGKSKRKTTSPHAKPQEKISPGISGTPHV